MASLGENRRGALMMAAAMAAYTINDAFMKLVGEALPLFQAIMLRGLAITAALLLLAWVTGGMRVRLAPGDGWKLVVRTVSEAAGAILFLSALFNMSLANVTAILQTVPLMVTLGAALFLSESVGWRRLTAVVAGFLGVLLIVRPGTEGFDAYSLLVLLSVVFLTLRDLVTRSMSGSVSALMVAAAAAIGVTLVGAVGSVGQPWVPISPEVSFWLAGATLFAIAAYVLSITAVRAGDMGFVAPFRYSGLVWALVLGFLVFGDWPDGLTILGAAVIVGAGLFTFARERKLARASAGG